MRSVFVCLGVAIMLAGCASNKTAEEQAEEGAGPSKEYSVATAKTDGYSCPSGYVLRCETRRVGRIRFASIGKDNIESCSCEYNVVPNQSPLPGIY